MLPRSLSLVPLIPLAFLAGCDIQRVPGEPATLRPAADASHPVAFYQGIPLKRGELRLTGPMTEMTDNAGRVSALASAASYWPDGTVQWLRVEGVVRGGVTGGEALQLKLGSHSIEGAEKRASRLEVSEQGAIRWVHEGSGRSYSLVPEASLVTISKPKPEPQTDPDWLDREGQYAWSMPLEAVSDDRPTALNLRVRQHKVEAENRVYSVILIQGDGGDFAPGNGLEWQLRAKVFHEIPLVRAEMTWIAQWDVTRHALASAKWSVVSEEPWSGFALPGGEEATRLKMENDVRGAALLNGTALADAPDTARDGLVALSGTGANLAVGIANFSRLGPNHLLGEGNRIEIASWSDLSGRALDLRRSTSREDYGTSGVDLKWNGKGVSRTLYASLSLSDNAGGAHQLARYEAARDYLWFPTAGELAASGAFGPISTTAVAANPEAMSGMQANLHFLRASRDHWRWTGWANFGDIRTNFAKGDVPARGLHAGHWVLHGRYGWRNASGTISTGFIQTGILLNDRALILAGVDNAEHIADVDAFHGSLFSEHHGKQGGLHRRNRDHWSGDVQAQYSPNAGLYYTQWLTGGGRLRDTLAGLRGYASRNTPNNSVFPAQAWLMHYQETRDPAALTEAKRLLEGSTRWWMENKAASSLSGLSALYSGNFRRVTDGMWTLILFHQATGDPAYLNALEASARAHPPGEDKSGISIEAQAYLLAYLRSQGITDLPGEAVVRQAVEAGTPPLIASPATADYPTLQRIILEQLPPAGSPAHRESAHIAHRATYLPVVLEQYGKQAQP